MNFYKKIRKPIQLVPVVSKDLRHALVTNVNISSVMVKSYGH